MKVLLIVCAMLFVVPAVHAGSKSGNELSEDCKTSDGNSATFQDGVCLGYVLGAKDSFEFAAKVHHVTPDFCIPDGVTNGQVVKVVVKYLNNHPEDLHYSAESLVVYALGAAFRCAEVPDQPTK